MRVSEMRAREDFDAVLAQTLSAAWTAWRGAPHRVTVGDPAAPGQRWTFQPLLSAYYVPSALSRRARRYLADSFRHTPVAHRRLPQLALGTLLATRAGLTLAGRPGFTVDPPLPDPGHTLVVPGNQRLRLFDFRAGRTRVVLKRGFDAASLATEVRVRTSGPGPFPPVLDHGLEPLPWLEEPLLDAWALPRCPPHVDTAAARQRAVAALDAWLATTARREERASWIAGLRSRLTETLAGLTERFGEVQTLHPSLAALADALADLATRGPEAVEVALTHGDFQPGNILVDRADPRRVTLIDWEHAAERARGYDRLVFTLGTRSAAGLAGRLTAWLGAHPGAASRAELALFLLEDLAFFAGESLLGPYRQPSAGLIRLRDEVEAALPRLAGAS